VRQGRPGKGGSDVDSAWLICVEGELVVFWQKGKKAGGVRQHADVRRMPAGRQRSQGRRAVEDLA